MNQIRSCSFYCNFRALVCWSFGKSFFLFSCLCFSSSLPSSVISKLFLVNAVLCSLISTPYFYVQIFYWIITLIFPFSDSVTHISSSFVSIDFCFSLFPSFPVQVFCSISSFNVFVNFFSFIFLFPLSLSSLSSLSLLLF